MSNSGNFDITSVFQLQSDYLNSLSPSQFSDIAGSAKLATYVNNLQNKLEATSNTYSDANTSSRAVLTDQLKMKEILNNEQQRLDEKQNIMNNAKTLEERKQLFSNTERLEYGAYTQIMLMVILCLVIHILLRWSSKWANNDGENKGMHVAFVLLHIVNIAVCGIIIIFMYLNIRVRSDINYNRLNIPPPNADDFETKAQEDNFDDILNSLGICYGDSCCGEDTRWDATNGTCIPIDLVITPSGSPNVGSAGAPLLGEGINTTVMSTKPPPTQQPASNASSSQESGNTLSLDESMQATIKKFYETLGDSAAFRQEVEKLTNTKLSNSQLKEMFKKYRLGTLKKINDEQTSGDSSTQESFATYNQLYNISNELLPCHTNYPYKDSSLAQPNDNLLYMKTYK